MPMSKILKDKKIKPLNLSLFSDYNPKQLPMVWDLRIKKKPYTQLKL